MLSNPTTFVLGAGASSPYGFPLGGQLTDFLQQESAWPDELGPFLRDEFRWNGDHVKRFKTAVRQAAAPSIDLFLAKRAEYADAGRALIAYHILQAENDNALIRTQPVEQDWLRYLWQNMLEGCENAVEFKQKNAVSFVTYNYDRSVERTFSIRLSNLYAEVSKKAEIADALASVEVVHVHGSLGPLPDFVRHPNGNHLGFGDRTNKFVRLLPVSKGIQLIGEHNGESANYRRARELLAQASRVVFLGFSFHHENVKNLRPPECLVPGQYKPVMATRSGMTEAEFALVARAWPVGKSNAGEHRIEGFDKTAKAFLREHIDRLA
jgi:hypothetical protein